MVEALGAFVPSASPLSITFPGLLNSSQTSWNYELGNHGFGNRELQEYVNTNALCNGYGGVKIVVTKKDGKYYSSRITTQNRLNLMPGTYVEAMIKAPTGKGIWPAFWLIGVEGPWPLRGEIDIMEGRGLERNKISQAIHLASKEDVNKDLSFGWGYPGGTTNLGLPIDFNYNTYGVYFSKDEVKLFVNRRKTMHVTKRQADDRVWPFDKPQFLVMNVAINSGGSEGEIFPKTMYVKSMKYWPTGIPF